MGKLGSFGSALGSLLSFFVRLSTTIVQYAALILSLGFSTFLIGKYTHRAIHSRKEVVELVYWRDPKKSAAVLAAIFVVLYVFQRYAFHSIVVYAALAALVATVGLRAFKLVEGYYKKTDTGNPFQNYLDLEVSIPQDKLHAQVDLVVDHAMFVFKKLRHIYLVENLLDSIKFGLLLYSLTYVASWFSGLGLIVLFVVAVFALPKTYELYKEPIDQYIQLAKEQIEHFNNIAQEKLPFLKGVVPPSSSVPAAEKKEE